MKCPFSLCQIIRTNIDYKWTSVRRIYRNFYTWDHENRRGYDLESTTVFNLTPYGPPYYDLDIRERGPWKHELFLNDNVRSTKEGSLSLFSILRNLLYYVTCFVSSFQWSVYNQDNLPVPEERIHSLLTFSL